MNAWPDIDFSELVADKTSGNEKTLQSDYLPSGRFPIVDQGQDLIGGYTNDETRLCKAELPAIVFGDHTKCFKFIDFPFCLGADGTKVLRPKGDLDERYLFYALQRIYIPDSGYSRHFKYLKKGSIPVPSLGEQKRIAAILDKVDELCRKRQRAIDRLNQLGQAIFHDMFGEKILLGENRETIAQVSQRVTKGESPKWQGHSYVDSGALFVTSENVGWGEMINKTPKFVPLEFHNGKLLRSQLRQGDLLINLVGASIGRACLFQSEFEEANINQAVAVVSLKPEYPIADYLLAYILSPVGQAQILGNRVEGARANISLKNVRDFSFYMPAKDELLRFNQAKAKLVEMRDAALALLEQTNSLFASIQHSAFEGEL